MKPTLQNVATLANVSVTTASFALRNHPKAQTFNPETVARIREAARQIRYKPNFFAMQSQREHSQIAMVCVPNLLDPYASAIAENFQQRGVERDYWTLLQPLPKRSSRHSMLDERIIGDHGISAVALISLAADMAQPEMVERAIENGVTFVTVGTDAVFPGTSCVQVDNYHGGTLVGEHLLRRKRRRIAYLHSSQMDKSRQERYDGIRDALAQGGLSIEMEFSYTPYSYSPDAIIKAARKTAEEEICSLPEAERPDAIATSFDLLAIGVASAFERCGVVVGEEVDIIGYDDIWLAETMHPPLTTIHQPVAELGKAAADLLFDTVEGKETKVRDIIIKPEMIYRRSAPEAPPA